MAKQLYWSIEVAGCENTPPPGLECVVSPGSLIVLHVSDSSDPGNPLLDETHADVLTGSEVRGRRVATLIAKVLNTTVTNGIWNLHLEYDEAAILTGDLSVCDICQAECLTCATQSKVDPGIASEGDSVWADGYGAFLIANPELDTDDLTDLDPPEE